MDRSLLCGTSAMDRSLLCGTSALDRSLLCHRVGVCHRVGAYTFAVIIIIIISIIQGVCGGVQWVPYRPQFQQTPSPHRKNTPTVIPNVSSCSSIQYQCTAPPTQRPALPCAIVRPTPSTANCSSLPVPVQPPTKIGISPATLCDTQRSNSGLSKNVINRPFTNAAAKLVTTVAYRGGVGVGGGSNTPEIPKF
jgi:hypothetical protein